MRDGGEGKRASSRSRGSQGQKSRESGGKRGERTKGVIPSHINIF